MTPAEYAAQKAATIATDMMREHAVTKEVCEAFADALFRECLAECASATAGLPIGTRNLAIVADAIDAVRRRKVG